MPRFRATDWGREVEAPFQALQGELYRLFDEYWRPDRQQPTAATEPATDLSDVAWSPAFDLDETADVLILRVDIPGVDPNALDLSLTGLVLTLRGERVAPSTTEVHVRTRQRPSGTFQRQVTLPEHVDFDRIKADCKNGVLTVELPKTDHARPRSIPIQAN